MSSLSYSSLRRSSFRWTSARDEGWMVTAASTKGRCSHARVISVEHNTRIYNTVHEYLQHRRTCSRTHSSACRREVAVQSVVDTHGFREVKRSSMPGR